MSQRPYRLVSATSTISTSNPEPFLDGFEAALSAGERFTLSIARSASRTLKGMNDILREHGLELQISTDSDPEAADYVSMALIGGAVGAAGGAGTGAALWTVARLAGAATPLAPFIVAGSLIGLVVGAATGLAVTRWGLTVRFAPSGSRLELDFVPVQ